MADLVTGVSERERDQGGQAERRADLLHGGHRVRLVKNRTGISGSAERAAAALTGG